jgi:hypothetical protein
MRNSILVLMLMLSVRCALAQPAPPESWKCIPREFSARLRFNDPAYTDAVQLSQVLSARGLKVRCVLSSKMAQFFAGQKGAALYRTEHGDFEALFAVRPEDFAGLSVVEQPQRGGLYVYEFYGNPEVRGLESSRREYFVKHGATFVITRVQQIAASLNAIFGSQ